MKLRAGFVFTCLQKSFRQMSRLALVFAALVSFCLPATAAVIFEPSLGYSLTQSKSVDLAKAETKSELASPLVGLRLGYISNSRFWLGVDGMYLAGGKMKVKEPAPTTGGEYDATAGTAFASLGYETRSRLRFWAGYGVYDTITLKDYVATGVDATYSGGTSWKAGLGLHLVNHLALNLEYVSHSYKRYKTQIAAENDLASGGLESLSSNTTIVTLSMPFFW